MDRFRINFGIINLLLDGAARPNLIGSYPGFDMGNPQQKRKRRRAEAAAALDPHVTVFMHQGKIWESGPSATLFARLRAPELQAFRKSGLHRRRGDSAFRRDARS